jgi:predicted nucleic acid-binding Zn ribbon protein
VSQPHDPPEPPTGGASAVPPTAGPPAHEESGLDLARSVARSLAKGRKPTRRTGRRPARVDPQASGAHPDDRDPQTLDLTIGRLVAEQGWGTDVRVHAVFARWEVIVGREVAQHVKPVSYERDEGRLVVQTDSTAWKTQMGLLAATVVRRLNQELGDGTVKLIDVRGPAGPSWKRGLRSVRDGRGPRDTYG